MKKHLLLTLTLMLAVAFTATAQSGVEKMLKKIPAVKSYETLEKQDTTRSYYLLRFTQQIDPNDASVGTFEQRVMLGHRGYDRPTVIVTEGYGGAYAFNNPRYMEELTYLLDANILFVEYRYFLESTPEGCDWQYLTVANSMVDLHNITTAFKEYYKGKWVSTGVSKGGSTTMFYRAYYPEDVDVSVPYVAPLSCALEDGRHESFMEQASTKENRDAVRAFQMHLLENKDEYMPLFDKYCLRKGYTFRVPTSTIYDLCVLEYQFSFWQWGSPISEIPATDAGAESIVRYFLQSCDPEYFSLDNSNLSFYVQAVKDFGYYGYFVDPFSKYIDEKDIEGYMKSVMLPAEFSDVKFDDSNYRKVVDFYTENDPKVIFIYGQWDPWTASGVTWLADRNKENIKIFIEPDGSHRARIGTMPKDKNKAIMNLLQEWLQYR